MCDEAAHSNGFLSHEGRTLEFLELEALQHFHDFCQVCESGRACAFRESEMGAPISCEMVSAIWSIFDWCSDGAVHI